MPVYEVRRRMVLFTATVTAANETEARFLARDAWQQDAAIASLTADVKRVPGLEVYDRERDEREPEGDRDSEVGARWGSRGES